MRPMAARTPLTEVDALAAPWEVEAGLEAEVGVELLVAD